MNYRHAFHAGGFADVAKHIALVLLLLHMRKKQAPFAVVDTHAGRGLYDLCGEEARRTGEGADGIGRLRDLRGGPPALEAYLDLARDERAYPGSPLIAARLLRPQDRLVAVERHPEEAVALAAALRPFRKARAESADGYARLAALLPPPERRAVVLIDPPFEADDEYAQAADAFATGYRRFATGIYLLWFPVKSRAEADGFCGEVVAAGARKALRLDVALAAKEEDRLTVAGLLVVNPPYQFEEDMRAALARTLPLLGCEARFDWLAGAD